MNDPLTPAAILTTLKTSLEAYLAPKKGKLFLARDPFDALSLLAESPAGFRVILHWAGDSPMGDDGAEDGVVLAHVELILSHNVGLTLVKGANLITARAGQQPLYELVSQVRAHLRAIEWPDEVSFGSFFYRGCESVFTPDGVPLDAYKLRFDLLHSLPVHEDAT